MKVIVRCKRSVAQRIAPPAKPSELELLSEAIRLGEFKLARRIIEKAGKEFHEGAPSSGESLEAHPTGNVANNEPIVST